MLFGERKEERVIPRKSLKDLQTILLVITLVFTCPVFVSQAFAKAPWSFKTTVMPGKGAGFTLASYRGKISVSGLVNAGVADISRVDLNLRSPQGGRATITLSNNELIGGIAHTANLKGSPTGRGGTASLRILKIMRRGALVEVLLDDRPDNVVDGRKAICSLMVGSRVLKGKYYFGPFLLNMGISGSRSRKQDGSLEGKISDLNLGFKGKNFHQGFSFPRDMIFEGAVRNFQIKGGAKGCMVEVEILRSGPGWLTLSLLLSPTG